MDWTYRFRQPTSYLASQPVDAPASGLAFAIGTDGRYNGVLRRYPGHIRYPDSGGSLGAGTTFTPNTVREFKIQKMAGSSDKVHGAVVSQLSDGSTELWYKFSGDADGTIRKQAITQTAIGHGTVSASTATVTGTGVLCDLPLISVSGGGFYETSLNPSCVYAMTMHDFDDGNGSVPVIAGRFTVAGGRVCSGVAKIVNGRYMAVGNFSRTVMALASYKGHLVAGGFFDYVDGVPCARIACLKNGSSLWAQPDSGVVPGHAQSGVFCFTKYTISGTEYLVAGGKFSQVGGATGYGVNLAFLLFDTSTEEWSWPSTLNTNVLGVNNTVYCLLDGTACTGNTAGLFVGGVFTADEAATGTFNRLVRITFSGSTPTFTAIGGGTGVNAPVHAMCPHVVSGSIYLHLGGQFTAQTGGSSTSLPTSVAYISGTGAGTITAVGSGSTAGYCCSLTSQYLDTAPSLYVGMVNSTLWDGVGLTGNLAVRSSGGTSADVTGLVYNATAGGIYALMCSGVAGSTIYWGGNSYKAGVSPWSASTYIDVTYSDRFLYILASNGEHRTIYWDEDASAFQVKVYGPELSPAPGPALAYPSSGRLRVGRYQCAWRAVDRFRNRLGPVCERSADIPFSVEEVSYTLSSDGKVLNAPPRSYGTVQVFSTTSSLAHDVGAGGPLYLVTEGRPKDLDRSFSCAVGATASSDNGAGDFASALNDDSFALRTQITPDTPIPGEIGDCYACEIFQNVMFAVEREGAFLRLRWSPTTGGEFETFPYGSNYKRLDITASQAPTVALVTCGDFLFLIGGDRIYRIQKSGYSVGIVEMAQGYPFIHRDGYLRAGTTLYAVSQVGLLQVDSRTGAGQVLSGMDRLFLDRWRGQLIASSETSCVKTAHDARMDCLYFHHVGLKETLCLWMTTGDITFLEYNPSTALVSMDDLDDESCRRAYFLTDKRWLYVPNWEYASTSPQTMTGVLLWTGQSTHKYNAQASGGWVDNGSTCTGTFSTGIFSTDGTGGTAYSVAPCYVTFLTGDLKGQTFSVSSNTYNTITVDTATAPATGDWFSISPIHMMAVGSNLWLGNGQTSLAYRKKTTSATLNVGRVSSNTALGQTTPAGAYSNVVVGVSRNNDLLDYEPKTSATAAPLGIHLSTMATPTTDLMNGAALNVDQYAKNVCGLIADGTVLYPWLWSMVSNLQLEVYEFTITGAIEAVKKTGPG